MVAVDVEDAIPVVFDSYEKEYGTSQNTERFGRVKSDRLAKNEGEEAF